MMCLSPLFRTVPVQTVRQHGDHLTAGLQAPVLGPAVGAPGISGHQSDVLQCRPDACLVGKGGVGRLQFPAAYQGDGRFGK